LPHWIVDRETWYVVESEASVCPGWTITVLAGSTASAVTVVEFSTTALIWIAARLRSIGAAGT